MLGVWFMATDYVTTPITKSGQIFYGMILGVLTGLFRIMGGKRRGCFLRNYFRKSADSAD